MARILSVGAVTLDIINEVDGYPNEDDEIRALSHRRSRGGNAANTAVVLSQLGHHSSLATIIPEPHLPGAQEILDNLEKHSVDTSPSLQIDSGCPPTSYILINRQNGSRTIVHYRDAPEFTAAHFARIPLREYGWVHFGARNIPETRRMMARVVRDRPDLSISLEIEKPHDGIDALLPFASVIICSRAFALAMGHRKPGSLLKDLQQKVPRAILLCPWGEQGAYGLWPGDQEPLYCPAHQPTRVVETLGAGDVFNAAVIDAMIWRITPEDLLTRACRLAGRKCGQKGLDHLFPRN